MPHVRPAGIALVLVLAAPAVAGAQPAAASDEGTIQYRQKVMSAVGADMGAIGDILKYGLPFQSALVAHAQSLSKHADLAAAAFERKVVAGPTDAKPAVWDEPERFLEKMRAMKAAADELAEIAADSEATPAAIGTRVKALGDSCGDCHKVFRKPKEESYKRASGA